MSRSSVQPLLAAALVPLVLVAVSACAGATPGSATAIGAAAAPTTAAASDTGAYCTALAQLGVQTKQIMAKPKLEALDFLNVADAYDNAGNVAPAELKGNFATVARDYRLVGRGSAALRDVQDEIKQASSSLTAASTKLCVK